MTGLCAAELKPVGLCRSYLYGLYLCVMCFSSPLRRRCEAFARKPNESLIETKKSEKFLTSGSECGKKKEKNSPANLPVMVILVMDLRHPASSADQERAAGVGGAHKGSSAASAGPHRCYAIMCSDPKLICHQQSHSPPAFQGQTVVITLFMNCQRSNVTHSREH